MNTLIDFFAQFHKKATAEQFSPAIRTLYYHLLGEWNSKRRPVNFVVNHAATRALCGLETTAYYGAFSKLIELNLITSRRLRKNICEISMQDSWFDVSELPYKEKERKTRAQSAHAEVKDDEALTATPSSAKKPWLKYSNKV